MRKLYNGKWKTMKQIKITPWRTDLNYAFDSNFVVDFDVDFDLDPLPLTLTLEVFPFECINNIHAITLTTPRMIL